MAYRRHLFAAALASIVLAACGRDASLDALAAGERGRVAAVLSGDTLRLEDGRVVRLAGLEAPREAEPFATEARQILSRLAIGREVELLHGGPRTDSANRLTGHVRLRGDRRWLQALLLDTGAARVRIDEDRALASEMLELEARARAAGRGLWGAPSYRVALPGEVDAQGEGFHVVEGRVLRATRNGPRLYLEFSPDWRSGFSAETPIDALASFDAAGVDLSALQGVLVRVRGEVRPTRYGPRLRLDRPEQLERLSNSKPDRR